MSEIPGQDGHSLPAFQPSICANSGLKTNRCLLLDAEPNGAGPEPRLFAEMNKAGANVRFDQKEFEPNAKEYDQMLNKMHGICKGC
jgi:hypothetical protein